MKKIDFMLTAFRDGFQSVFGARVFSKDYLPLIEYATKECGIKHLEAGGGALFQSSIFYTRENAFDIMDSYRKAAGPDAELQTLARGISVVALKAQPKDVIDLHARMFKKHGISVIRNFDALNDVNNLIWSGQCIHNAGLKHEVAVTMMELPPGCTGAHDVPFYEKTLRSILDAGIPYHSVVFKDASGTSCPHKVHETIKMARKLLGEDTHIVFHSHETAGTGTVSYIAAIEGGASQIDLSLSPVSGGTSQPDLITMWHALRGTKYTLDINIDKIFELSEMFKEAMRDYFIPPEATKVEPVIPFFPMPGGALTANTQMLRDNNLMDKYPLFIDAMGEAVRKGGFGTSVTPVSQFYFQQAFNNVMFGPWKKIAEGYGNMVLGYFGKTPVTPDPEVVKIASDQLGKLPTTDHLSALETDPTKGLKAAQEALEKEKLPVTEENLFIVAACEEKGIAFLQGKGALGVRKVSEEDKADTTTAKKAKSKKATPPPTAYDISINGQNYNVRFDGPNAVVNGKTFEVNIKEANGNMGEVAAEAASKVTLTEIKSQLPGLILRIDKTVGAQVKAGEVILIVESMKMETPITAPHDGTLSEIMVTQGAQVVTDQLVAKLLG
ncbi:MAG: biotin/lipoyl-containing protein [Limisphaerales bacterium]|jgi:pyruvate carboxylase subunit B|nr:biotin attachment protein [Verrucomicrobiota bacterium]